MAAATWMKSAWIGGLLLAFAAFSAWYGGNGKPISNEEGAALLERFKQVHANPPPGEESFVANIEEMIPLDDGKEFYAVNLEQLKEGEDARSADQAYAKIVFPLLFERAGHPVIVSQRAGLMLGDYGRDVDRVAVVRYRSLRDMIEMTLEPTMVNGGDLKFASLDHTEVFVTRPIISFVHVRFFVALIVLIVGLLGLRLIDFIHNRRRPP
ncbi:MAG: hypothetical protein AAFY34_08045 [Pseudomonadota bacterium]